MRGGREFMLWAYAFLIIRRAGAAVAFAVVFGVWAPVAIWISAFAIIAPILVPEWVEDYRWSRMVNELNARRGHAQR